MVIGSSVTGSGAGCYHADLNALLKRVHTLPVNMGPDEAQQNCKCTRSSQMPPYDSTGMYVLTPSPTCCEIQARAGTGSALQARC